MSAMLSNFVNYCIRNYNQLLFNSPQVLSALDILQPPHIDYFEEMYPSLFLTVPNGLEFQHGLEKCTGLTG